MNKLPGIKADFLEAGSGPVVMLVHSSVSGARQWRRLMDELKDDFHVRAVNLYGYGRTPPWLTDAPQSLDDQRAWLKPRCHPTQTLFALSATPSAAR
jgi:pimeloyl-ACP methyl ester carboxylesterase